MRPALLPPEIVETAPRVFLMGVLFSQKGLTSRLRENAGWYFRVHVRIRLLRRGGGRVIHMSWPLQPHAPGGFGLGLASMHSVLIPGQCAAEDAVVKGENVVVLLLPLSRNSTYFDLSGSCR